MSPTRTDELDTAFVATRPKPVSTGGTTTAAAAEAALTTIEAGEVPSATPFRTRLPAPASVSRTS